MPTPRLALTRAACLLACVLGTAPAYAARHAKPVDAAASRPGARDARLWEAAEAARPGELELLSQLVAIDSGTGDATGGNRVVEVLVPRLEALGMAVRRVPAEAPGLADNLVASLAGRGRGRILVIAHLDTVFGPGTVAKRPFRAEGARAYGPGVADEKGGVAQAVTAIGLLRSLQLQDFGRITLLVESSEERGSPGTRALIAQLLAEADVELNVEPGDPPDALTVWRKGSTSFELRVQGRAAHAGVAPQDGRNAAEELVHQVQQLQSFPRSGDGVTVNLTLMNAGTRVNIIPEQASATWNARVREASQGDELQKAFEASAAHTAVPGTTVTVHRDDSFPPLPTNPATEALADRAAAIYSGVGLQLARGGNGGASESALAHEQGVPALDGLGPVGGGFHSDDEYLELGSVVPRLYLFTRLLAELGAEPPARGP